MQPTTPQMNTVPQYPGATAPFLQVGQSRTDANGAVTTKIADIPTGVSPSTPSTIPLNVATGNVQPVKLPSAPVSGTATSLSSQAGGYLSQPVVTGLNQLGSAAETAGKNLEVAQGDYQSQIKDLLNQMTNRPAQLEGQYNIQGLSADAMKAKANYDSVELGYRRQKEALMTNGAISADQKQANLSELDRKEASQKADIAIDYNLKAGLLSNAKELMNKQIELELEPMKLKADYYKTIKEDYKDVFNTAQNRQIDYLAKKEERAYQSAQKEREYQKDLIFKAIDAGIYDPSMKNMSSSKILDALATNTAKSGGFDATIETAASLEPATLQKAYKGEISKAIANKDYKTAVLRLQNTVSKALTGENKTSYDAKKSAIPAIDELADKLKAYEAAGGDTGILKGKAEDIANKLGKVNDPKFKSLATDLKISLQKYRNDMSGAAFTEQEAKEYASVNPAGNKSINLNLAIIDGMRSNFKRQVDSTVDSVVGEGAKYIREYAQYQGLPKVQALNKYITDHPEKSDAVKEMLQVPGVTSDQIITVLGLNNLIQ